VLPPVETPPTAVEPVVEEISIPIEVATPEPGFAARVPPPEPERPRPSVRRAIFFDVENSSRVEHVAHMLQHLRLDRMAQGTELVAVGNWRVINHETARLLSRHGADLVHSAPSVGVRDWSDLRIAVTAGVWLASARPGDAMDIVSDDQAFDAVGDVAASLGVRFHRLSFRSLAGITAEPIEEPIATSSRSRRRRRGGRRRRGDALPRVVPHIEPVSPAVNGGEPMLEAHTAPHDELLAVARELLQSHAVVTLDMLSNALKSHGFRRTPGSPRLITRLRRIRELEVTRQGTIRLVDASPEPTTSLSVAEESPVDMPALVLEGTDVPLTGEPTPAPGAPARRRRRRRGGRGRRGRGAGHTQAAAP